MSEARKEGQEKPAESKAAELPDQDLAQVAGRTGVPGVGKVLPSELSGDDLSAVAAGGPAGPTLDDARYEALLNDALARIPVRTPDWTGSSGSPIRKPRPR